MIWVRLIFGLLFRLVPICMHNYTNQDQDREIKLWQKTENSNCPLIWDKNPWLFSSYKYCLQVMMFHITYYETYSYNVWWFNSLVQFFCSITIMACISISAWMYLHPDVRIKQWNNEHAQNKIFKHSLTNHHSNRSYST